MLEVLFGSFLEKESFESVEGSEFFKSAEGCEGFGGVGGLRGPKVWNTLEIFELLKVLFGRLSGKGGANLEIFFEACEGSFREGGKFENFSIISSKISKKRNFAQAEGER